MSSPSFSIFTAPSATACAPAGADELIVAPTQPGRGRLLVRVLGEIDLLSADRLQSVLLDAVAALAAEHDQSPGLPLLVCDMQGVEFLGASGLAALARVGAEAAAREVGWTVVATGTAVRRPLELVALNELVPVASTSPLHQGDAPPAIPTPAGGQRR